MSIASSTRTFARSSRPRTSLTFNAYSDFLSRCSGHSPWVWKDPRLTWTIRVWVKLLDMDKTAFLVLTRDDVQAWISANTRRHIQSLGFTRNYNHGITRANVRFIEEARAPVLQLSFEDLLLDPEKTLARLNGFFGLELSLGDLQSVCREPLYRKSRGWKYHLLAALIYIKNYGERDGRGRTAYKSRATSSL